MTVQDYEKASSTPSVWVVNIPNDNASVRLSSERPFEGKQCAAVRYRFTSGGPFQYLGVPNKVRVLAPIRRLRYRIRGDNSRCSYGVQISDVSGETHQYSPNTGQCGILDFTGWREVVVNMGEHHETWGGDRNGTLDYPITAVTFTIGQPKETARAAADGEVGFDAVAVESTAGAAETLGIRIDVTSPAYCSEVEGPTRVRVSAPGVKRVVARCWRQGGRFGADSVVATVGLDEKGRGAFTFPAGRYPHGPITLRISGEAGAARDTCYLQLYNKGGVSWREGLPKAPPAAEGMALVFADDFIGPLSISSTDPKATYYDHKPPNGRQDFSVHRFTSHGASSSPFLQVGTYLRIRASDAARSAGLISSLKNDASGVKVKLPCYFECRFIGPNAVGTWPAFWLMTDYMTDWAKHEGKGPCDELDIIEAYGGEGPGSPNADDTYMITPHCWNQGDEGKTIERKAFEGLKNPCRMRKFGIPSTWFEALHIYGCKITETDTIYYCDDIEVGRHTTFRLCREKPLFFMVNLATGGGWPVDLSRYGGLADMYVDYVRVYAK